MQLLKAPASFLPLSCWPSVRIRFTEWGTQFPSMKDTPATNEEAAARGAVPRLSGWLLLRALLCCGPFHVLAGVLAHAQAPKQQRDLRNCPAAWPEHPVSPAAHA